MMAVAIWRSLPRGFGFLGWGRGRGGTERSSRGERVVAVRGLLKRIAELCRYSPPPVDSREVVATQYPVTLPLNKILRQAVLVFSVDVEEDAREDGRGGLQTNRSFIVGRLGIAGWNLYGFTKV